MVNCYLRAAYLARRRQKVNEKFFPEIVMEKNFIHKKPAERGCSPRATKNNLATSWSDVCKTQIEAWAF